MQEFNALPAGDLVSQGITDLLEERESVAALLVSIGEPRLRALGLDLPRTLPEPERRLYQRLSAEGSDAAHSRYNALVRRLVSFERALACVRS